jgi:uncharacterized protein YciU (UPF0263 family)
VDVEVVQEYIHLEYKIVLLEPIHQIILLEPIHLEQQIKITLRLELIHQDQIKIILRLEPIHLEHKLIQEQTKLQGDKKIIKPMYIIDTTVESVFTEFPHIEKWIKNIHKKILKSEIDNTKITVYYSYGFFVPKLKNDETDTTDVEIFNLKFKKRLNIEMSKVRVDITIKIGNFIMTNRLLKQYIPEDIKNLVTELTKVRMMIEGEYHQNQKVIDSIPEVDTNIVKYKIIRGDEDVDVEQTFDIDLILDKISNDGIQSLTPEEKAFLDKRSKHM